jgi:hypothetical protein
VAVAVPCALVAALGGLVALGSVLPNGAVPDLPKQPPIASDADIVPVVERTMAAVAANIDRPVTGRCPKDHLRSSIRARLVDRELVESFRSGRFVARPNAPEATYRFGGLFRDASFTDMKEGLGDGQHARDLKKARVAFEDLYSAALFSYGYGVVVKTIAYDRPRGGSAGFAGGTFAGEATLVDLGTQLPLCKVNITAQTDKRLQGKFGFSAVQLAEDSLYQNLGRGLEAAFRTTGGVEVDIELDVPKATAVQ